MTTQSFTQSSIIYILVPITVKSKLDRHPELSPYVEGAYELMTYRNSRLTSSGFAIRAEARFCT